MLYNSFQNNGYFNMELRKKRSSNQNITQEQILLKLISLTYDTLIVEIGLEGREIVVSGIGPNVAYFAILSIQFTDIATMKTVFK